MDNFALTSLYAFPVASIVAFISALVTMLLTQRNQHDWDSQLETLRSDLARQSKELEQQKAFANSLVLQAQSAAHLDQAEVTQRQLNSLDAFWKVWLELRNEAAPVTTFQRMFEAKYMNGDWFTNLLKKEGRDATFFTVQAQKLLLLSKSVEALRPFIKEEIYEHYRITALVYTRQVYKFSRHVGTRSIPVWFKEDGSTDENWLDEILKYSAENNLNLPDPRRFPKSESETFSRWVSLLEQEMAFKTITFVNGAAKRAKTISDEMLKTITNAENEIASEEVLAKT